MSGGDLLGRFGVSREAEAVWLALIEAGEASIADLAVLTARSAESVSAAVEKLLAEGLVSRDPGDARLRAVEPTLAVEAQLVRAERRLAADLEELRQIRTHLPDLSERHARSQFARTMSANLDIVLEPDEIRRHIYLAAEQVREIARSMIRQATAAVMREAHACSVDANQRGVEQRTLVTRDFLADAERFHESLRLHQVNDNQRSLPSLPTHLLMYDSDLVVLPLVPEDVNLGAMFIRERGVIEPLIALFDGLWAVAQPVFEPSLADVTLPQRSSRVLELVAAGATDDHISRSLGVTTRTVRREVAGLRDALGVGSRMEIVPAAVRRGWL